MTAQPAVLARVSDIVQPALRKAVGSLDPHLRTPLEYHMGWVEPDGTPIDGAGGGKGIRPALAVLGAEAAGGQADAALPAAVAIELIHNFSLIHDDIIDRDRMRRHRRTVWDVYGEGDAIILGDALHTLAFEVLLEEGGPRHLEALQLLATGTSAMIAGQAQDTSLDRRDDASVAECLAMEADKTAALLAVSVAAGAVLAGAEADMVTCLRVYGTELGLCFQAIDDLLGIWGDPARTGKPVGSDLREHKKSLPVAIALESGGSLADDLRAGLDCDMTADDIADLSDRLRAAGIEAQVGDLAMVHLDAALDALTLCPINDAASTELAERARFELAGLARFVVERNH